MLIHMSLVFWGLGGGGGGGGGGCGGGVLIHLLVRT